MRAVQAAALVLGAVVLGLLIHSAVRVPPWPIGQQTPWPEQAPIVGPRVPWEYKGAILEPLASYRIQARVLSRLDYEGTPIDAVMPMDLALGWGLMSDEANVVRADVEQGGRWYTYRWKGAPPSGPWASSSANTHLIPATPEVERQLRSVRVGHWVRMTGRLVSVKLPGQPTLRSSLSRGDQGGGACEILWVETVQSGPWR